jgi:hypothetical protein
MIVTKVGRIVSSRTWAKRPAILEECANVVLADRPGFVASATISEIDPVSLSRA